VARRRTLELSSFRPQNQGADGARGHGANNEGGEQGRQPSDGAGNRTSSQNTGGFPMTSFPKPTASNQGTARRPATAAQGNDRNQAPGLPADDDDAADQLQRELELFA
jgi:hypothetical protein